MTATFFMVAAGTTLVALLLVVSHLFRDLLKIRRC
jgi:hypothetical protein